MIVSPEVLAYFRFCSGETVPLVEVIRLPAYHSLFNSGHAAIQETLFEDSAITWKTKGGVYMEQLRNEEPSLIVDSQGVREVNSIPTPQEMATKIQEPYLDRTFEPPVIRQPEHHSKVHDLFSSAAHKLQIQLDARRAIKRQ
jgi:hypothetical protein